MSLREYFDSWFTKKKPVEKVTEFDYKTMETANTLMNNDANARFVSVNTGVFVSSCYGSPYGSNTYATIPVKVTNEDDTESVSYVDSALFGGAGGVGEATIGFNQSLPEKMNKKNELSTQTVTTTNNSVKDGW